MQATTGGFSLEVRGGPAPTVDRQPRPSMLYRSPLQLASPAPATGVEADTRSVTSPWRGHSTGEFGSPQDDTRSLNSSFRSTRRRRGEGSGVAGDGRDWTQALLDLERMRRENQDRLNESLRPERSPGNSPPEDGLARSPLNSSAMSSVRRRRRGVPGGGGVGSRATSGAPFEESFMDNHQCAGGFTTTRTDSNYGTPAPVTPFAVPVQTRYASSPTTTTNGNRSGNGHARGTTNGATECVYSPVEGDERSPTPKLRTSGLPNWLRLPPPDQGPPTPEAAQEKPARPTSAPAPTEKARTYAPASTTAAAGPTAAPAPAASPPRAAREAPPAKKRTVDVPAKAPEAAETPAPHLATPPTANTAVTAQRRPSATGALRALREAAATAAGGHAAEQPATARTVADEAEVPDRAASTARTEPSSQVITPSSSTVLAPTARPQAPTPSAARQPIAQTYVARHARAAAAAAVGLTAAPASPPRVRPPAQSTWIAAASPAAVAPAAAGAPASAPLLAAPAANVVVPPLRTPLSSPPLVTETDTAPRIASALDGGAEPQPLEVPAGRSRASAPGVEGGEPEPRLSLKTPASAVAKPGETTAAAPPTAAVGEESPRARPVSTMRPTRTVRKDPSVLRRPAEDDGAGERTRLSIATARRLLSSVPRQRQQVSTARTMRDAADPAAAADGGDAAHPPGQGSAAGVGGRVLHRATALTEMRRQEVLRDRRERERRAVEEARACLGPVHPSTSTTAPPRRSTGSGSGGGGPTAAAAAVEQTPARQRTTGGSVETHSPVSQDASPTAAHNRRRMTGDGTHLRTHAKDGGAAATASTSAPPPPPAMSGLAPATRRPAAAAEAATPAASARPSMKLAKATADASPLLTAASSPPRGGQPHSTGAAAPAVAVAPDASPSPVGSPASCTRRVTLNGPLLRSQQQHVAAATPAARTPVAGTLKEAGRAKSAAVGKSGPRPASTLADASSLAARRDRKSVV